MRTMFSYISGTQTFFYLTAKKILETPKSRCLCGLHQWKLTTFDIKTEIQKKCINSFRNLNNKPITFHINNMVMKNNNFPSPPKLVRRAMLYIFATLSNAWLNRRELDSRQILHVVACKITSCSFWNISLYIHE